MFAFLSVSKSACYSFGYIIRVLVCGTTPCFLFFFFGILTAAMSSAAENEKPPNVWAIEDKWDGKLSLPTQASDYKVATINRELFNARIVNFPLPEGGAIRILREEKEGLKTIGNGGLIWTGKVIGDDGSIDYGSIATFSNLGKVVVGDIVTSKGKMYRISHVAGDIHVVMKLLHNRFPNQSKSSVKRSPQFSSPPRAPTRSCPRDDPQQIDVLVGYTDGACQGANSGVPCATDESHDAMVLSIYQAMSETNQTYANSSISQRLSLVHVTPVTPYSESTTASTIETDLDILLLRSPTEAVQQALPWSDSLHRLHDLREQYSADAVVLITKPGNCANSYCPPCGRSPPMEMGGPVLADRAFAVVTQDCLTGHFGFGHELGHLMGANHDVVNAPEPLAFTYSHGFTKPIPSIAGITPWRTAMSYQTPACLLANPAPPADPGEEGCIRLPFWSNPLIKHPPFGDDMGDSITADNHSTLNLTADDVANNRSSSICRDDVWMKDTWQDSGDEPDLKQAGKPMWKSPYIWVRNEQDPDAGRRFQHQHQNPIILPNQKNWAYVKIHNGGFTTSGELELRFAPASTGLVWDGLWPTIGAKTISLPANSTTIVEFPWEGLPGPGHYCLVARWLSSDDPMTMPEGPSIEPNVRNNNNIVWRNLNIIDLTEPAMVSTFVTIANPNDAPMRARIDFRFSPSGTNPLRGFGEMVVELDPVLKSIWSKGGSKSQGLKLGPKEAQVDTVKGASLFDLNLPPQFMGKITLKLKRSGQETGVYQMDIVQSQQTGDKTQIVGGVSYEIHTEKR